MFRLTFPNAQPLGHAIAYARMLHASPAVSRSLTDKVTEAADKVNKKMGKGLASAIEAGEKAAQSTKESVGSVTEDTKSKAEHMTKEAKQKADKAKQDLLENE